MEKKIFAKLTLLLFLLNGAFFVCKGQPVSSAIERPIVIPTSPEATSMTKYGDIPVGLFTGTVQFTVPIYTVSEGALSHAISLNYGTNGVKVDEISSRIGIGWNLGAGGVITRTTLGKPDNLSIITQLDPAPSDVLSDEFYEYLKDTDHSQLDGQPDEYSYSFAGNSGKFFIRDGIVENTGKATAIKIIKETGEVFQIITPDGTKYFFGEGLAYDKTEAYYANRAPSRDLAQRQTITAWYLTKIISPLQDSIVFKYNTIESRYFTGISEYLTKTWIGAGAVFFPPYGSADNILGCNMPFLLSTDYNMSHLEGVYLSKIEFTQGAIDFKYSDRTDITGEKKLDSIIIKSENDVLKKISLEHIYSSAVSTSYDVLYNNGSTSIQSLYPELRKRLFLATVKELNKSGEALTGQYRFDYDSINYMPSRLSYSQDLFGFFNGKINPVFYPNNTILDDHEGFPRSGGDRSYNFEAARKGVLKKITYPTGGASLLEYEPHDVYTASFRRVVDLDNINLSLINSNTFNQVESSLPWQGSKNVFLNVEALWVNMPEPEAIRGDEHIRVSIKDAATNYPVYQYNVLMGNTHAISLNTQLSTNNNYIVELKASHLGLTGIALVRRKTMVVDTSVLVPIGGLRIKNVQSTDSLTGFLPSKWYKYGHAEFPDQSGLIATPDNIQDASVQVVRNLMYTEANPGGLYCSYYTISSSSPQQLFINELGTITYPKVIEYFKSDSTNGGTEHRFVTTPKKRPETLNFYWPSQVWFHSPLPVSGTPLGNNDFLNGHEYYTANFKLINNNRQYVNKTYTYLNTPLTSIKQDTFYAIKKVIERDSYVSGWNYFYDYDINRYMRYTYWDRLDSTRTVTFSENNQDSIIMTSRYKYSANPNLLPSEKEEAGSDGKTIRETYQYPFELALSPNVYSKMVEKNMISEVLKVSRNNISDSKPLDSKQTHYQFWNNNAWSNTETSSSIILSKEIQTQILNEPLETRLSFNRYTEKGKILEVEKINDIKDVYLWGYHGTYPVAKVTGSEYTTVAGFINQNILDNAGVTYSDQDLRTELNKIRIGLASSSALVYTFTYKPLVGMTSETAPNGKTVFYEYDSFNRLHLIKDDEGKIVKRICYNYAGQVEDCGIEINTTPLWESTSLTRCQPCPANNSYVSNIQEHQEKDNNPNSPTYNTYRWVSDGVNSNCAPPADWQNTATAIRCKKNGSNQNTGEQEQEQRDMNPCSSTYNQTRWVVNGTNTTACPISSNCNSSNCIGDNKKCIDDRCRTGFKVYTHSVRIGEYYECTYHYEWIDGSWSIDYTEISPSACAL